MPVIIENRNGATGKVEEKIYETIAERVRRFREKYPISAGWFLGADPPEFDGDKVRFRALIKDPQKRIVATGHAEEIRGNGHINVASPVENCETSALGRVLSAAGFGDGEFCSADELLAALQRQERLQKVETNLREEATVTRDAKTSKQSITDKNTSAAGGKLSPPTDKDGDQKLQGNTDSVLPGLLESLPALAGVRYARENGYIIAEGNVYQNRNDLKDAGFKFSQQMKKWMYAIQ